MALGAWICGVPKCTGHGASHWWARLVLRITAGADVTTLGILQQTRRAVHKVAIGQGCTLGVSALTQVTIVGVFLEAIQTGSVTQRRCTDLPRLSSAGTDGTVVVGQSVQTLRTVDPITTRRQEWTLGVRARADVAVILVFLQSVLLVGARQGAVGWNTQGVVLIPGTALALLTTSGVCDESRWAVYQVTAQQRRALREAGASLAAIGIPRVLPTRALGDAFYSGTSSPRGVGLTQANRTLGVGVHLVPI